MTYCIVELTLNDLIDPTNIDHFFLKMTKESRWSHKITISSKAFLVSVICLFLFFRQGCQLFSTRIISSYLDSVNVPLNAIRDSGSAINSGMKLGIFNSHERHGWGPTVELYTRWPPVAPPRRDSVNLQHACGQRCPPQAEHQAATWPHKWIQSKLCCRVFYSYSWGREWKVRLAQTFPTPRWYMQHY